MSPMRRMRPPLSMAVLAFVLFSSGCEEQVVSALPVDSIQIEPDPITLLERSEQLVSAVVRGPQGQILGGRQVSWTVEDPSVASLEGAGILKGVQVGETRLRASADGVERWATVTVLQGPTITFDAAAVELEGVAGQSSLLETAVLLSNSGNGDLTGVTARPSGPDDGSAPDWLEVSLSSSQAPAELTVRADLSALEPGRHDGGVVVESPVAPNSPAWLPVRLDVVEAPPVIGLSPGSVAFTSSAGSREPASQDVSVVNQGGGTLDGLEVEVVYTEGRSGWLSAPLSGSVAPTVIQLEALAQNLNQGVHRAVVRVRSVEASPPSAEVEVTFTVSAGN